MLLDISFVALPPESLGRVTSPSWYRANNRGRKPGYIQSIDNDVIAVEWGANRISRYRLTANGIKKVNNQEQCTVRARIA